MFIRRCSYERAKTARQHMSNRRKNNIYTDTRVDRYLKWTYHYQKYYIRFYRKTMVKDYSYYNKYIRE